MGILNFFTLWRLNSILLFSLIAFFLTIGIYPIYIKILQKLKIKKTIREEDFSWKKSVIFQKLHWKKAWTPTMGWGLWLIIVGIMVLVSYILSKYWYMNSKLWLANPKETWLLLLGFFGMGSIWLIDDILNVFNFGKVKGLNATWKTIWMTIFAWIIAFWFYFVLWIDYINLRPFAWEVYIWIFAFFVFFFITMMITHAINFTDWLDWLAWGMMLLLIFSLIIISLFLSKFLTASLLSIVAAILTSFLLFNINPAKVFMWDSWAFALGGLLSVVIFMLNAKMGIFIPFFILFLIFIVEFSSSALQIFYKKFFKKKLFKIAPFHHLLEYKWMKEYTIVMKFWLIQLVLCVVFLIIFFYQYL